MTDEEKDWYYGWTRPEMQSYVPTSARTMLEVGCARGAFSAAVRDRFGGQGKDRLETWGVEIVPEAAAIAETRLDRVFVGDIFEVLPRLPRGYFDCVVFNDVLEHLVDPYRLLEEIQVHLTPGGVVVASIPNVRHLQVVFDLAVRGAWTYQEWGVLDRTHLRFFTAKSIAALFEDRGYDLLKLEGLKAQDPQWDTPLHPFLRGPLRDMRFRQFACVARPRIFR